MSGQTEIDNYAEKMPKTNEKPLEGKGNETEPLSKSFQEAAVESGENNESPPGNPVSKVVGMWEKAGVKGR